MGVQARTNEVGVHSYFKTEPWHSSYSSNYWGDPYVDSSEGYSSYLEHECQRDKHESPKRLLSPAGPVWRDPAPFARHVLSVTKHAGGFEKEEHGFNYRGDPYTIHQVQSYISGEDLFYWDFEEGAYSVSGGGPSFPNNDENKALAKCLSKLKDGRANWGENLGEAVGTFRTLAGHTINFISALRAVKHGNLGLAAKHLRNRRGSLRHVADTLLEWKFGWLPLASDIYSTMNLFKEQCKPALIMSAHSGFERRHIPILPKHGFERNGGVDLSGHSKLYGKVTNANTLAQKLGLANPFSLGWELVPFSFVVDWITPIGSVLDSFVAPQGLDYIGGYSSARFEGEFSSEQLPDFANGWTKRSPRLNEYRTFNLMRKSYDNWPTVGLYVKSPFSLAHGVTSFELLIQKLWK